MRKILKKTRDIVIRYKYKSKLKAIRQIGKFFTFLSHKHLLEKISILKQKMTAINDVDLFLEESFALVCESTKRVLGIFHFDVQLIGGIVLNQGNIAEMKTGEGKSIVALLPTFLYALYGLGSHVITVNNYLAERDAKSIGQVYKFLGLTVGLIQEGMEVKERKINYTCDVTYLTNNQLAFDYLKSNMAISFNEILQRHFFYCLIDEIDSILLDTARIPLILSKINYAPIKEKYLKSAHLVHILQLGIDYLTDEKNKTIILTALGMIKSKRFLKVNDLYSKSKFWISYLFNAIRSKEFFKKDIEYIINQKNKIILVDEFTGRTVPRLRLNNGLHQSLEAKENILIKNKNEILASITYQGLLCLYVKLSGMTGTAKDGESEFKKMYNLKVIQIPSNQPSKRQDFSDLIYKSQYLKWRAVIRECFDIYTLGRPVLVCTTSIAKSELVHSILKNGNVRSYLLNAKPENIKIESEIIYQAGYKSAITISTTITGRGTDIKIGGDAKLLTKKIMTNFLVKFNKKVSSKLIKDWRFQLARKKTIDMALKIFITLKTCYHVMTIEYDKNPEILYSAHTLALYKFFYKQITEFKEVIPQRAKISLQRFDKIKKILKRENLFDQFLSKSIPWYKYPILSWVRNRTKIKYPFVNWLNFTYKCTFSYLLAEEDSFIISNIINNWKRSKTIFSITKIFSYLKFVKKISKYSFFNLIDIWFLDFYLLTTLTKKKAKIKYYLMYCFFLQKFKQKVRNSFSKKFSTYFSYKNTARSKIYSSVGVNSQMKFMFLNTIINHDNQTNIIYWKITIRLTLIKTYLAILFEILLTTRMVKNRIKKLGGLHVIGTERHDSSRIDIQLQGRSGRQGEPGSSRFFLSLEDKIFRVYGGDELINVMASINFQSSRSIHSNSLKKCLTLAQQKLEFANFEERMQLSKYEIFSNVIRNYIYAERQLLLKKSCLIYWIFRCLSILLCDIVICVSHLSYSLDRTCKKRQDLYFLIKKAQKLFYFLFNEKVTSNNKNNLKQPKQLVYQRLKISYFCKYFEEKSICNNSISLITKWLIGVPIIKNNKSIILDSIDNSWKDYLRIIHYLQKSIQLRLYGLYTPLIEYRREVIDFFNFLVFQIRHTVGYQYVTNRDISLENLIGYFYSK